MNSSIKIIEYAIEMEKQAHDFYTANMETMNNKEGKDLFKQLADIEKEHMAILKRYHSQLSSSNESNIPFELDDATDIFERRLKESNVNLKNMTGSDLAIMRMAYIIENDFAEFYKNAASTAKDSDTKKLLNELSKWENSHRELFYKDFQDMMSENWFEQKFYPF